MKNRISVEFNTKDINFVLHGMSDLIVFTDLFTKEEKKKKKNGVYFRINLLLLYHKHITSLRSPVSMRSDQRWSGSTKPEGSDTDR